MTEVIRHQVDQEPFKTYFLEFFVAILTGGVVVIQGSLKKIHINSKEPNKNYSYTFGFIVSNITSVHFSISPSS